MLIDTVWLICLSKGYIIKNQLNNKNKNPNNKNKSLKEYSIA